MVNIESLWGDEFTLTTDYDKVQQILKKVKSPKSIESMSPEEVLKSKTITFEEKLKVTEEQVNKKLGKYRDLVDCIYTKEDLEKYIDAAIFNGVVAIDTETLGTRTDIPKPATDPFTCRIAGLCLYTPGQKSVYIPVNHVDHLTGKRIENQVTEEDIKEALERLNKAETFNIYHNGKFDYMVLYYTCGVRVPVHWDTMIGAQVLNENEKAGLKFQYRDKVDPDQEKYDIDELFDLNYSDKYPIELFALYSGTDPYITYKLYEYQRAEFKKAGNEKLYSLFKDIEMPAVAATTEMEMRGIAVDKEFAQRLSVKFHRKLDELNEVIANELDKYTEIIKAWRLTPEANAAKVINNKKQKSLSEKLSDPVELTSPTQLGILLYDVLHVLKLGKDGKKTTDEAALKGIEKTFPLASLILKKREYEKLLGTYIDVLPTYCNPRDGRVHAHFNQMGREDRNVVTGRMSSSDPSLQVIPARGEVFSIRCMFRATTDYKEYEPNGKTYEVPIEEEVLLKDGTYKWSSYLTKGDVLEDGEVIDSVIINDNLVTLSVE